MWSWAGTLAVKQERAKKNMIKLQTPTGIRYVKADVIQEFGINESDPTNVICYVILKENAPNAIPATVVVDSDTITKLRHRYDKPTAGAVAIRGPIAPVNLHNLPTLHDIFNMVEPGSKEHADDMADLDDAVEVLAKLYTLASK